MVKFPACARSDIDLRTSTLAVNQARAMVEDRVRIEEPESRNGKLTLPLGEGWSQRWPHCASASYMRARLRARRTGQDWLGWTGARAAST